MMSPLIANWLILTNSMILFLPQAKLFLVPQLVAPDAMIIKLIPSHKKITTASWLSFMESTAIAMALHHKESSMAISKILRA